MVGAVRRDGLGLPPSRSFVVQLAADAEPVSGTFAGRIEHIVSGRSGRFASLDELSSFIADVLANADDEPD